MLRSVRRPHCFGQLTLIALAAISLYGCGAAPAAPSSTPSSPLPPATALSIEGATILRVGASSQLVARRLDGTVAAGVQWKSTAPSIATVSADGLITSLAEGTSRITADASAINAHGSVGVIVQAGPIGDTMTLTSCANITAPGHYVVDRDLPSPSPCFSMRDVANIELDCQGHSILAIVLDHVRQASIHNCSVGADIKLTDSDSVTVAHSTIRNGLFWAVSSTNLTFDSNTLVSTIGLGSVISLQNGSNNRVVNNSLDGSYTGGPVNVGVDDDVTLFYESGDTIDHNTIANFYDAGIEGIGTLADTTLSDNTISNVGAAGIASYWCTAWTNDVVRGTTVSVAPMMVRILYETGSLCSGPIVPAAFSGNQFVGNVFRNPSAGTLSAPRPKMSIVVPGSVDGNLIKGNDFGLEDGPFLSPLSGFGDGGGNVCGPPNPALSNFACSGASARRR